MMDSQLNERLARKRFFHALLRDLDAWAKTHGLTAARFEALGHIEANELTMTQGELAQKLGVSQAATSRMVSKLSVLRLIAVLENATDRRKRMFKLTDEGRRRLHAAKMNFTGPLPAGFIPLELH
jgi:DNA-binding MarR family transcriptional regulator